MYVEASRLWNEGPYDPPTAMHTPVNSLRLDSKLWAILRGLGVMNMCVFYFFKSFRSWLFFLRLSFAVFEEMPSLGGWLVLALGLSLFVELGFGDVLGGRGDPDRYGDITLKWSASVPLVGPFIMLVLRP